MQSTRVTALEYIIAILLGFHDFKTLRFTKAKSCSDTRSTFLGGVVHHIRNDTTTSHDGKSVPWCREVAW